MLGRVSVEETVGEGMRLFEGSRPMWGSILLVFVSLS
jgi:hypothetical protein